MSSLSRIKLYFARAQTLYAKLESIPGGKGKALRIMAFAVPVLVGVVLLALVGYWLVPKVPGAVWRILGLATLALVILLVLFRGIPWYRQRRFIAQYGKELEGQAPPQTAEPSRVMEAQLKEAVQVLERSPDVGKGRDPVYRIPWYLVVGDADAGQEHLLSAARRTSPFSPPERHASGEGRSSWYWWFYKGLVAIETNPDLVCDVTDKGALGLWYHALRLLDRHRTKLPLNGVLVLLSAPRLIRPENELRETGIRLRRMIDSIMRALQIQMPVYVVVTNCDELAGFAAFANALPRETLGHVLGHRFERDLAKPGGSYEEIETVLDRLGARLHAIRLGILKTAMEQDARMGAYEFVEGFRDIQKGLRLLCRALFEQNPLQRTPYARGLYLTASQSPVAFVDDLFVRYLPQDQPLAVRTRKKTLTTWLGSVAGAVAVGGLSVYAGVVLTRALNTADRTPASATVACLEASTADLSGGIASALLTCRDQIVLSDKQSADQPLIVLTGGTEKLRRLKQGYVADFGKHVVTPLDRAIRKHAHSKPQFGDYLAVVQRLALIDACRDTSGQCQSSDASRNVIFTPQTTELLDVLHHPPPSESDPRLEDLLYGAYIDYLRWQEDDDRAKERSDLAQLLETMLAAHPPTPQDVVAWAAGQYDDHTMQRYWQPPPDAPPPRKPMYAVEAAFTNTARREVVAPFVVNLGQISEQTRGPANSFHDAYLEAYFDDWRQFLSAFFDGAALWQGRYDQLADSIAKRESPYDALWTSLTREVFALDVEENRVPAWSEALKQALDLNWVTASGLFSDLARALADDPSGGTGYDLASELYSGDSLRRSVHAKTFGKLWALIEEPPEEADKKFKSGDRDAWAVIHGPARLLVLIAMVQSGRYLDKQWREKVYEPLQEVAPDRRLESLLRENGKLDQFVGGELGPFLSKRDQRPEKFLGISLPLTSEFEELLYQAPPGSGQPFKAATVEVAPSRLGVHSEGEEGTAVELDCQTGDVRITSKAASLAESRATVFWSPDACSDVRLSIAFPKLPADDAEPRETPPPLVRIYSGRNGFADFLREFGHGGKTFTLEAFRASYAPHQWKDVKYWADYFQIHAVTTSIQVTASPEMVQFMSNQSAPVVPTSIVRSDSEAIDLGMH